MARCSSIGPGFLGRFGYNRANGWSLSRYQAIVIGLKFRAWHERRNSLIVAWVLISSPPPSHDGIPFAVPSSKITRYSVATPMRFESIYCAISFTSEPYYTTCIVPCTLHSGSWGSFRGHIWVINKGRVSVLRGRIHRRGALKQSTRRPGLAVWCLNEARVSISRGRIQHDLGSCCIRWGSAGIGRRARLRTACRKTCGFESHLPHHLVKTLMFSGCRFIFTSYLVPSGLEMFIFLPNILSDKTVEDLVPPMTL